MNTRSFLSAASALLLTPTQSTQEVSLDTHSVTSGTLMAEVYGTPNDLSIVVSGPQVSSGIQTPFGMLYLDPAHFLVLGSFPLDKPYNWAKSAYHIGESLKRYPGCVPEHDRRHQPIRLS